MAEMTNNLIASITSGYLKHKLSKWDDFETKKRNLKVLHRSFSNKTFKWGTLQMRYYLSMHL